MESNREQVAEGCSSGCSTVWRGTANTASRARVQVERGLETRFGLGLGLGYSDEGGRGRLGD